MDAAEEQAMGKKKECTDYAAKGLVLHPLDISSA